MTFLSSHHSRALPRSHHGQGASAAARGGSDTKNVNLEPELGNDPGSKGHSCPTNTKGSGMGKGGSPAPHPAQGSDLQLDLAWGMDQGGNSPS